METHSCELWALGVDAESSCKMLNAPLSPGEYPNEMYLTEYMLYDIAFYTFQESMMV